MKANAEPKTFLLFPRKHFSGVKLSWTCYKISDFEYECVSMIHCIDVPAYSIVIPSYAGAYLEIIWGVLKGGGQSLFLGKSIIGRGFNSGLVLLSGGLSPGNMPFPKWSIWSCFQFCACPWFPASAVVWLTHRDHHTRFQINSDSSI